MEIYNARIEQEKSGDQIDPVLGHIIEEAEELVGKKSPDKLADEINILRSKEDLSEKEQAEILGKLDQLERFYVNPENAKSRSDSYPEDWKEAARLIDEIKFDMASFDFKKGDMSYGITVRSEWKEEFEKSVNLCAKLKAIGEDSALIILDKIDEEIQNNTEISVRLRDRRFKLAHLLKDTTPNDKYANEIGQLLEQDIISKDPDGSAMHNLNELLERVWNFGNVANILRHSEKTKENRWNYRKYDIYKVNVCLEKIKTRTKSDTEISLIDRAIIRLKELEKEAPALPSRSY